MRALLILQFCLCLAVSPVSVALAQERPPPAAGEPSPAPPTVAPSPEAKPEEKPPEEKEKVPPPAPVALPGAPEPQDVLDFQMPQATAPPPPPGLTDRFQRSLDLVQPGQVLFNLSVEEVYDSNAFNTSSNPDYDFITTIVPGIAVEQVAKNASLRLRYTPRIDIYARFPGLNRVNHALGFAGSWDPTPGIRLYLQDSLLITNNPVQASPLGISQTGTRTSTQNRLTPGAEFRLGPEDDLVLEYRNSFLNQEGGEDNRINGGRVAWRHRFPRGGVTLDYTPAYVDRSLSNDAFNQAGTLRVSYTLNPTTDLLFSLVGSYLDERGGDNSAFAGGDVGINHQFTPQLSIRLTAGGQVFGLAEGNPKPRFSTDSRVIWTIPRGQLTAGFVQRYQNTFATINDVGVVLDTRVLGSFSYQLGPRLSFSVDGSYGRVKYQERDQTDYVGRARIDVRYRIWQNLSLTAGYNFFDRNSTVDSNDLLDNRVFFGLSLDLATPI